MGTGRERDAPEEGVRPQERCRLAVDGGRPALPIGLENHQDTRAVGGSLDHEPIGSSLDDARGAGESPGGRSRPQPA